MKINIEWKPLKLKVEIAFYIVVNFEYAGIQHYRAGHWFLCNNNNINFGNSNNYCMLT